MKALLAAELIKLRTTRTFFALAGVAIATSLLITILVASLTEPTEDSVLVDVFTADTSSLFILVLAVVGITGEWRHRTITSSLLAATDRVRFLAAKALAFAAAGALLSLAIAVAIAVAGFAILSARGLPTPDPGELLAQVARNAGVAALLGGLGVGIGSLVRNQPVAIVGVLLMSFAIEPILFALVPSVGRYGPFVALPSAVQDLTSEGVGEGEGEFLSPGPALAGMLAWIGVLFAAGAALLRRRDLNA